jgi:membrane protease subunit HflK
MSDERSILTKPTVPEPLGAPSADDAGSRALSDALRSSFFIVKFIMVGLVLVFLASGFFAVKQEEQAIILRFGNPVGQGTQALLQPGFHWAWPKPIDEIVKIPINSIQIANSSVGWYSGGNPFGLVGPEGGGSSTLNPASDSYALTSDRNIIHVAAQLRYRITDPIKFHFEFTDAATFVTNALNNALLFAASQFKIDEVLTGSKSVAFREHVASHVKELIDQQQIGITVEQLDVKASPPLYLMPKFFEFGQATVKRDILLKQSEQYSDRIQSQARADFESRTNKAQAERTLTVQLVNAEAKKFMELLPNYERDPQLFTTIRQMDTLQKVFASVQDKYPVPHRAGGKPLEVRIQVNREPRRENPLTNNVPTP